MIFFDRDYDNEPLDTDDDFIWVRPCLGCDNLWFDHPDDRPTLFCQKCGEPLRHFVLVSRSDQISESIKVLNPSRGWRPE